MARPRSSRPTDGELAILNVLWRRGPSTVREVHDALRAAPPGKKARAGVAPRASGYTSVLKIMQIMTDKGLVRRDEENRSHVYHAAAPREQTQRQIVGDLVDRVFGGSARALVMHALSAKPTTPEELAQIRKLIDEFEGGKR
jgi:BlaI family transcriptional regulator, penicillinase repressor